MSGKVCKHHSCDHKHYWSHNQYWWVLACLLGIIFVVLLVIFIVWLALRPTKPRFYLQDATVYGFNISGGPPNLLNVNIQVTISSRNPNDRVGIYYDRLAMYATYKYQQITPATVISRFYQGHKDVNLWSPFLCGVNVPLAPYLAASLEQDRAAGIVLLYVRIDGRVRWKVGSWTSGRYHLFVSCPALLMFGNNWAGAGGGYSPLVRFDRTASCSVSV